MKIYVSLPVAPLKKKSVFDHDETRTRNLLIRSQTPYPLGHAVRAQKAGSFERQYTHYGENRPQSLKTLRH